MYKRANDNKWVFPPSFSNLLESYAKHINITKQTIFASIIFDSNEFNRLVPTSVLTTLNESYLKRYAYEMEPDHILFFVVTSTFKDENMKAYENPAILR